MVEQAGDRSYWSSFYLIELSLMETSCAFSLSLLPSSKLVEFLITPDVLFSCLKIERRYGSLSDFSII